jgi:hypothetical protein
MRHGIFLDRNEFCESTDSIFVWPRKDFIAGPKSPHSRSYTDDNSGQIIAQNER